jgi:riboflavin kinase/FMN adenylyltransferase
MILRLSSLSLFVMRVSHSLPVASGPLALTIGNFDGVHRGHQAMLARLSAKARALGTGTGTGADAGVRMGVLTFEPHPREVFTPQSAPTRLTSLREKLELLAAHGVEHVHVARFTPLFAALSPVAFIEKVLLQGLHVRSLLIGDDFRFGAKRAGDFALLREAAAKHGFELEAMPTLEQGGARVSSSAVREALFNGALDRASALLGRAYSISGRVVHGEKLGRKLGFATANVRMRHNRPPLMGIYAVRMHGIAAAPWDGVASLGIRPTVSDSGRAALEVHLFDFAGEIYGRHVRVEFLHKIRDEEKYADLETLRLQIARDCDDARRYLRQNPA